MARGRDLPEVPVPSGRVGARTSASQLPIQCPPQCFPASRPRLAGAAQGPGEPGRPVRLPAPAPANRRLSALCPEALGEPRLPCRASLAAGCPVHSVRSSPLLLRVRRAVVPFGGQTAAFPQGLTTSRAAPTMSCGGRHPRSSRRRTGRWGTGATRTCSEPAQRLRHPPVRPSRRLTSVR